MYQYCIQIGGLSSPHTVVVRANLEGLISAHNQTCLVVLSVLEEPHITGTTLLPLVGVADELEELRAHLESLLLNLLAGLDLDFVGEMDDGLEVNILGLWCLVLVNFGKLVPLVRGR